MHMCAHWRHQIHGRAQEHHVVVDKLERPDIGLVTGRCVIHQGILAMLKLHLTSLHLCANNVCLRCIGRQFFPFLQRKTCLCMKNATGAAILTSVHTHPSWLVPNDARKPQITKEPCDQTPRVANWLYIRKSKVQMINYTKTTDNSHSKTPQQHE